MKNSRLLLLTLLICGEYIVCGKKDSGRQKSKAALELARKRAGNDQGKELQEKFDGRKKKVRADEGRNLDYNAEVASIKAKGTATREYIQKLHYAGLEGSLEATYLAISTGQTTERTNRFANKLADDLSRLFGVTSELVQASATRRFQA